MALTSVNYGNLPGWPGGQNQGGHVSMAVFWDMLSHFPGFMSWPPPDLRVSSIVQLRRDEVFSHGSLWSRRIPPACSSVRLGGQAAIWWEKVSHGDLSWTMAIYHGQAEPLFFLIFNDLDYLHFQNVRSETSWYLQFHGLFEEWRILLGPSLFGCSCGIFVNAAALQVL